MQKQLEGIQATGLAAIQAAGTPADLEALRVKYLGKKGELTVVLKQMGKLSAEERPVVGQLANTVREALTDAIARQSAHLEEAALEARLASEVIDVTIPGKPVQVGHRHPMSIVLEEAEEIFIGMGFQIAEGPEVELSDYNFTRLNTPEGHPARDWQDTFYLTEDGSVLLRTQTSPVQVRVM